MTFVTPWDGLPRLVALELEQRIYEGAIVPPELRTAVHAVAGDDRKAGALLARLADLPADPDFPYGQPNDLDGIRAGRPDGPRRLPMSLSDSQLFDRFYGAWAARAAGCALGKPVELMGMSRRGLAGGRHAIRAYLEHRGDWPLRDYFSGRDVGDGLHLISPTSQREEIAYLEPDDDLNYTLIALHLLETVGAGFAWYDVADAWNHCLASSALCTAELVAMTNYVAASPRAALAFADASARAEPSHTRTHCNPYREWIGAQIRADGWGYACAGNPELAAELAWRDASWTHSANGIYAEMFFAAVVSAAFVERGPIRLIEIGLSEIPAASRLAEAIRGALAWFDQCSDEEEFLARLESTYGALHPTHAVPNALIVLMAIYYGEMDTVLAPCLAVAAGFDTDCNGATAGSIVGAADGYDAADKTLIKRLNDTVRSNVAGFEETRLQTLAERQLEVYSAVRSARPVDRTASYLATVTKRRLGLTV
jgi:ADP-ribosylglycohydrolase